MSDSTPPKPYGNGGLIAFFLINVVGAMIITVMFTDAINYERGTGNSITMAQAAYITSLWTKTIAYGSGFLAFDVVIVGIAICSRISALHQATIWAGTQNAKLLPPASTRSAE